MTAGSTDDRVMPRSARDDGRDRQMEVRSGSRRTEVDTVSQNIDREGLAKSWVAIRSAAEGPKPRPRRHSST